MDTEEQPTQFFDWTKPIEDMDGNPARVISEDYRTISGFFRIVQAELLGTSHLHMVDTKGYHPVFKTQQIRNRKTKHEGWVVIFQIGGLE